MFQQQSGADLKFDSSTSIEGGSPTSGPYTVTAPNKGDLPPGNYYSKIKKRDLKPGPAHSHICQDAKSPTVDVGP